MSTITSLGANDSGSTSRTTINTNFTNLNTDKAEITGQTFSGKVQFSGTTHAGLQLLSLTTAERDALTPVNGDLIYNETTDAVQMRQGGAWVDVTSVAADASTTVKGISEKATDAEIEAGTATGGTGAQLFVGADSSHLPSDNEMAALAGTSGTPSGSNKFITNDDVSDAAASGKVVRATGTALPALSGANVTGIATTNITGDLTDGSNADSLHTHILGGAKLSMSTSQVAIASSTTETSLGSFSLAANTLSTNNGVHIKIPFTNFEISTGTCTLRLKYGSTTLASAAISLSIGGTADASGVIEAYLLASGATNTQKGTISLLGNETNKYSESGLTQANGFGVGTSAEDSTGALTVNVTAQFSTSSAGDTLTTEAFIATLIK